MMFIAMTRLQIHTAMGERDFDPDHSGSKMTRNRREKLEDSQVKPGYPPISHTIQRCHPDRREGA